jgi:hypothetical protein
MDDKAIKGLAFLLLLVPVAIRYFIKTGNNDMRLNWIDYTIAVAIIVVVAAIN